MKSFFLTLIFSAFTLLGMAQTTESVEMADGLRASGMIYVVVAVMTIIFAGLLFYLFMLDSRLRKIEKLQALKN